MIHVAALEDMAAKLIDLGINITEHDLITTIICSISPVSKSTRCMGTCAVCWEDNDALRDRFLLVQKWLVRRQMDERASQRLPPPTNGYNNAALKASGSHWGHFNRRFCGGRARGGSLRDIINRDFAKYTYYSKARHYKLETYDLHLRIAQEGDK